MNRTNVWKRCSFQPILLAAIGFAVMVSLCPRIAASGQPPAPEEKSPAAVPSPSEVVVYPAPPEEKLSEEYAVTVNGRPLAVYTAQVWEPGYGMPFGGPYSFAYFDCSGSVEVKVTTQRSLESLAVLPESSGITPAVEGQTATFAMRPYQQISFEPNAKNGPLLLFANPIEEAPKANDPGVIYYGPGIHRAGAIKLTDNQTLYIAGGALVRGGVVATGKHIRILGHGVLDGRDFPRGKGPTRYPILLERCDDVEIRGIIIRDSWSWTLVPRGSSNILISNLKMACTKGENSDGIDVENSQHVRIEKCFLRTDDDVFSTKGFSERTGYRQAVEDIVVTDCVFWTDRAHGWRFGAECRAEAMRNMRFSNIDVIHFAPAWWQGITPTAISLQPAENCPLENIAFENIRIHGEGQSIMLEIRPQFTHWAKTKAPGMLANCTLKNISLTGQPGEYKIWIEGGDARHPVENVLLENVTRNAERATKDGPNVQIGDYVNNLIIR